MQKEHLFHLCCPKCKGDFVLQERENDGKGVKEGTLTCRACNHVFPIVRHIPRLLLGEHNYSTSFGYEWNKHYRTQYDSYSGLPISEDRFFKETRWQRDLKGQSVLEAGSGSGRFTVQAASTGATVLSFDYSEAVEANFRNNGHLDNVLIVQASILKMPFRRASFDKVFCIGVLQHTPNPEEAFSSLAAMLKSGGNIVIDIYARRAWWRRACTTRHWVRPFSKRIPSQTLYKFCERWVNLWWGATGLLPDWGTNRFSYLLCVADYRGVYGLTDDIQKEWAILDTFDMLSPTYDFPMTIPEVRAWLNSSGLQNIEVNYGYNGIEGRGSRV